MNSHLQESSVNSLELGVRLVKTQEFFEFVKMARLLRPDKSGFTMMFTLSLRGTTGDEAISAWDVRPICSPRL